MMSTVHYRRCNKGILNEEKKKKKKVVKYEILLNQ